MRTLNHTSSPFPANSFLFLSPFSSHPLHTVALSETSVPFSQPGSDPRVVRRRLNARSLPVHSPPTLSPARLFLRPAVHTPARPRSDASSPLTLRSALRVPEDNTRRSCRPCGDCNECCCARSENFEARRLPVRPKLISPPASSSLPAIIPFPPLPSPPDQMDAPSAPASGTTSAKRTRSPSPAAATKKVKTDDAGLPSDAQPTPATQQHQSLLPPSTFVFGRQKPADGSAETLRPPMETDVGILEYVRREGDAFHGIIKQRCVPCSLPPLGCRTRVRHARRDFRSSPTRRAPC